MLKSRSTVTFCISIIVPLVCAPLAVVALHHAQDREKVKMCANNLSQLWKIQNIYMSQFGGRMKLMPAETGTAFWLKLTKTQPPLIDKDFAEIFQCPVQKKDEGWGTCDYRGPSMPVSKLEDNDPVGADIDGNHGARKGGNVLLKSSDVIEVSEDNDLWRLAARKTMVGVSAEKTEPASAPQDLESRVKALEVEIRKLKLMLLLNYCADSGGGYVNRDHFAFLGIKYEFLKKETSETFGLAEGEGMKATLVSPDGPAGRAGIEEGDVLLRADALPLKSSKIYIPGKVEAFGPPQGLILANYVLNHLPGDVIELEVVRKGEKKRIPVQTTCKTCGDKCLFWVPSISK